MLRNRWPTAMGTGPNVPIPHTAAEPAEPPMINKLDWVTLYSHCHVAGHIDPALTEEFQP